jgi:hypothetical protein
MRRKGDKGNHPLAGAFLRHHFRFISVEESMTRTHHWAGLALGSTLLVALAASIVPSTPPASAQSQAERICLGQSIGSTSAGYEYCLSQATRALEWGKPELAYSLARMTADSRDACMAYGLAPTTTDYRACLERETHARSQVIYSDEPQYEHQIAKP